MSVMLAEQQAGNETRSAETLACLPLGKSLISLSIIREPLVIRFDIL